MQNIFIFIIFLVYSKLGFTKPQPKPQSNMQEVNRYIEQTWSVLTRDNTNLLLANTDEKLPDTNSIIYLSQEENLTAIKNKVTRNWPEWKKKQVTFKHLPRDISAIEQHGLLYLPYPYIVPGGRFNEMYGWDSYFIELGLLEHNHLTMARNMIDNLIYEINHYGTILNANRTYYLQRSQPPLLTAMIFAYYEKVQDKKWLKSTLPAIKKLHGFWTTPPHLIPDLGLSRYYAGGKGVPPEESAIYYEKVLDYFKTHNIDDYDKSLFYNEESNQLTELFYSADRTVRESGFDITAKFGPFSAGILDYAPVDLNVLIYRMEKDLSKIYNILGDQGNSSVWDKKAHSRAKLINHYLWDNKAGYYFDYNFKTKQLRPYIYATTFYPLWAGIASKDQARALVNNLPVLLAKGGLLTSCYQKGFQWDAPFGWAPLQYFAVLGLNRYGYQSLALDIANRFVNTIHKGFQETHTLFEKYDIQTMSIHTENKIQYSYNTNVVGFGWTNGVYLVFMKLMNAS